MYRHVNDLLETDQRFKEQYNIDRNTGKVGKLYGFDIYEYANTPYFSAKGEKKAVGDKGETAGDFHCSFAFYTQRVFKLPAPPRCTGAQPRTTLSTSATR